METIRGEVLRNNAPAPSMEEEKDFWRFHIKTSDGRIKAGNRRPTVESMKSKAVAFYRAFEVETKTKVPDEQRGIGTKVQAFIIYHIARSKKVCRAKTPGDV